MGLSSQNPTETTNLFNNAAAECYMFHGTNVFIKQVESMREHTIQLHNNRLTLEASLFVRIYQSKCSADT